MVRLYVYKTVKCEVINIEFFSKDFPLNNSAIMIKWKMKMCRIDSRLKTLIHLKYLILETTYTFFSIFSWHFSFKHT